MKILYHHRTLAKDGMNVHIQEMVAALERCGHPVHVVGPGAPDRAAGGTPPLLWPIGAVRRLLPPVASELGELAYNMPAFRRLEAARASFRPDVLYERYNLFTLAGMWLQRKHRLPMLLEVNAPLAQERAEHGHLAWQRLARRLEATVWRTAEAVLPVSHVLADHVARAGVPEDRIHVIPNGVDTQRFSPDRDAGDLRHRLGLDGSIALGFTGFMRHWHGLDSAIDVVADHGTAHNLRLLLIGDGPARPDLERRASQRNVASRVHFVGEVSRANLPAYVAAFDIALQPSAVAYASPLKLVEYMAMGKAIIAPDQPNIRELIDHGKTGLLIKPDHMGSLAEAVVALATSPERRATLGAQAARAVIDRGLTWEANARRVLSRGIRGMSGRRLQPMKSTARGSIATRSVRAAAASCSQVLVPWSSSTRATTSPVSARTGEQVT